MNIIIWVMLGIIEGWTASSAFERRLQRNFYVDIATGVAGSLIGGIALFGFNEPQINGIQLYSLGASMIGAALLLSVMIYSHTHKLSSTDFFERE